MYCSHCGAALPEGASFCGQCGTIVASGGAAGSAPQTATVVAPTTPPVNVHVTVNPATTTASGAPGPSMGLAIAGLLLNIFIWPGLGSLVAGDKVGWTQGFLFLLGIFLIFTIIGILVAIPLMIGVWVWGVVTGFQLINRAQRSAS